MTFDFLRFSRFWFVITVTLQTICVSLLTCRGQSGSILYTNFADYMTNRDWVNEMVFKLSRKPSGFTTVKASLQPHGMFFQYLTNSPYRFLYTFGESENGYWQTTPTVIDFAAKKEALGGSNSNRLQTICKLRRRLIEYVLNLGIDGLDNSNIKWTSKTEFTSPRLDWTGQPTSGTIHVKICSFFLGLPETLECDLSGRPRQHLKIVCRYGEASLPPSEVDITKSVGTRISLLTNIIENITFGLRKDAAEGFMPTNFYSGKPDSQISEFESNGFAYIMHTNGLPQLISKSETFPKEVTSRHRALGLVRWGFAVLLTLPLVVIIYKFFGGKPETKYRKQQ